MNQVNTTEITSAVIEALKHLLTSNNEKIQATATVNRGVCAGSVTYTAKPTYSIDENGIVELMRDAYAMNGLTIDMETNTGVKTFFQVFLEACRNMCTDNARVCISNLLVFEPQVYKDNPAQAYMFTKLVNSYFNQLPSKIKLSTSRALLKIKRKAAVETPFNSEDAAKRARTRTKRAKRAERITYITCPKCGEQIAIDA